MVKFGVGIVEDGPTGHELISVVGFWVESKEELDDINQEVLLEAVIEELNLVLQDEEEVDAEEDE
jgi:hypothetical protein